MCVWPDLVVCRPYDPRTASSHGSGRLECKCCLGSVAVDNRPPFIWGRNGNGISVARTPLRALVAIGSQKFFAGAAAYASGGNAGASAVVFRASHGGPSAHSPWLVAEGPLNI